MNATTNQADTIARPDIYQAIANLNTLYRMSIKDGEMTEDAWDNLTRHHREIEAVLKAMLDK